MAITQLSPAALPGRRYSFTAKIAVSLPGGGAGGGGAGGYGQRAKGKRHGRTLRDDEELLDLISIICMSGILEK
jgi:hypothetical protein